MIREGLEGLLERDTDLGAWFFGVLCESGPQAIEAQAEQMRDALRSGTGIRAKVLEVSDALLEIAHVGAPYSPSGAEDPRVRLHRSFVVWASRESKMLQHTLLGCLEHEAMQGAWNKGLYAYRMYLRDSIAKAYEGGAAMG